MKTNQGFTPAVPSGNEGHHLSTIGLSDNAFYLIALVKLLQQTMSPAAWQQWLISGTGNHQQPSCEQPHPHQSS